MVGHDDMERRESHIDLVDKISRIEVSMAKGFAEGTAFFKSTAKDIELLRNSHERIMHSLYGNGQEGIVTRIAKMSQKMNIVWAMLGAIGIAYMAVISGVAQDVLLKMVHP